MENLIAQTKPFQGPEVTTAPGQTTPDVATLKGLEAIFYNVIAVALAFTGIVLFIMLIMGGFKYMTAGADQQKNQAARQTLTYTFIGFIVIVAAFLILKLVEVFTRVPVTIFKVTN